MPRLLLVEDAADAALIVQHLGRRMGLDVTHRTDVASAWDWLRGARPDLILLDLNLPDERGEALCRRVRAAPPTADLPIALFTHWTCPGDVVSGLEAGGDYVVSKDLLARPAAWQSRLGEILAAGNSRPAELSLHCLRFDLLPQPSPEAVEAFNLALRHPLVRQLGPDVLRLILRRAGRRAADATLPGGADTVRWLQPDGLALDGRHLAAGVPAATVAALAVAVVEQLERLLGRAAGAPVWEALFAVVDRLDG
jgi:CheY-like chemotaxis protein